jgi:hypothetical protein
MSLRATLRGFGIRPSVVPSVFVLAAVYVTAHASGPLLPRPREHIRLYTRTVLLHPDSGRRKILAQSM